MATMLVLKVIVYSLVAIFAWICSIFMLVDAGRSYNNPKPGMQIAKAVAFQILSFCILFSLMLLHCNGVS